MFVCFLNILRTNGQILTIFVYTLTFMRSRFGLLPAMIRTFVIELQPGGSLLTFVIFQHPAVLL